jgi:hypothetical protein
MDYNGLDGIRKSPEFHKTAISDKVKRASQTSFVPVVHRLIADSTCPGDAFPQ